MTERNVSDSGRSHAQLATVDRQDSSPATYSSSKSRDRSTSPSLQPEIRVHDTELDTQLASPLETQPAIHSYPLPSHRSEDWSRPSPMSTKEDSLTEPISQPESSAIGKATPETITYSLTISLDRDEVPNPPTRVPTLLGHDDSGAYQSIDTSAKAHIHAKKDLAKKSLGLRHGACTVNGSALKSVYGLSSQEDWEIICAAIRRFPLSERRLNVHLDISRDYFSSPQRALTTGNLRSSSDTKFMA